MKELSAGDLLIVHATDPASGIDFRHFCDTTGHTLEASAEAEGVFTYKIRKS